MGARKSLTPKIPAVPTQTVHVIFDSRVKLGMKLCERVHPKANIALIGQLVVAADSPKRTGSTAFSLVRDQY